MEEVFSAVHSGIARYGVVPVENTLAGSVMLHIDLLIQHESPGADKESNWLPAPAEGFTLALRLYFPKLAVLDGRWHPPAVERL